VKIVHRTAKYRGLYIWRDIYASDNKPPPLDGTFETLKVDILVWRESMHAASSRNSNTSSPFSNTHTASHITFAYCHFTKALYMRARTNHAGVQFH
jgi:hypothetical protein